MVKRRTLISLVMSLLIFIGEVIVLSIYIVNNHDVFRFYTNDSNILLAAASLILVIAKTLELTKGIETPKWVIGLKQGATTCVSLTILTVYFYLIPVVSRMDFTMGIEPTYFLWVHTIFPIMAIVSYLFFDEEKYEERIFLHSLIGLIPTLVYVVFIIPLVLSDIILAPYPFLEVKTQSIYISLLWLVLMLGGTYLLSYLLNYGVKRITARRVR